MMSKLSCRPVVGGVALAAVAFMSACNALQVTVVGPAMAPTLNDGDKALASYDVAVLERGDIVGFNYPPDESKSFVMRIVGLPGEALAMLEGRLVVNEVPLDESYITAGNRSADSWGPITVPPDAYFVIGDNRRNSVDSRSWGTVRREAIWAKIIDRD